MNTQRKKIDNIVRISGKKSVTSYFEAITKRCQPAIYEKYGCVKLRFCGYVKNEVHFLLSNFWHHGLIVKDIEKLKEGLQIPGGYLENAYEITLVKIGALSFIDDEEFEKDLKKRGWDIIKQSEGKWTN
jgi:hypothetical protein